MLNFTVLKQIARILTILILYLILWLYYTPFYTHSLFSAITSSIRYHTIIVAQMHNPDSNHIADRYCRYGLQRLLWYTEAIPTYWYYYQYLSPFTANRRCAVIFNCHRGIVYPSGAALFGIRSRELHRPLLSVIATV